MASKDKAVVGMRFIAAMIEEKVDPKALFFACGEGKVDYITYLQKCLGSEFGVTFLGGNNNPVAKVSHPLSEKSVVLRFVPINKAALANGTSSEQALDVLQTSPRFQKPFLKAQAVETEFEKILLECSAFHEKGSLESFCNAQRSHLREDEFAQFVTKQVRNLFFLAASIRRKGVWHTDIKPSNLLLDDLGNLVLSDTKGLLLYSDRFIKRNRIDATSAYYDDSILGAGNQTDLNRLLQLNIAVSIYEVLTGELPEQNLDATTREATLKLDFSKDVFFTPEGKRLKNCIKSLIDDKDFDFGLWIKQLAKPAFQEATSHYKQSLLDIASHRQLNSLSNNGFN